MRTIIAGCRDFEDYDVLLEAIENLVDWNITEVVSGHARGVDSMGERWAKEHGMEPKMFKARWTKHGNQAGHRRNEAMGKYGEALLALWDGSSSGTGDMISIALKAGHKVRIWRID